MEEKLSSQRSTFFNLYLPIVRANYTESELESF